MWLPLYIAFMVAMVVMATGIVFRDRETRFWKEEMERSDQLYGCPSGAVLVWNERRLKRRK